MSFSLVPININLKTNTWSHYWEILSTFGTAWEYVSFWTLNVTEYKYRSSISDENLAPKLRCVVSVKYTVDFKNLVKKEM